MYRKIRIDFIMVLGFLLLVITLPLAYASFTYNQNNGYLSGFSVGTSHAYAPFQNYDPFIICEQNSVIVSQTDTEIIYEDFNLDYRIVKCGENILYSTVNYLIQDKDNLKIIYSDSISSAKQQAANDFSNAFGIPIESESVAIVDSSTIFIGQSEQSVAIIGARTISGGEIYVQEGETSGENNYILIDGEIESLVSQLIDIRSEFAVPDGCLIFSGCETGADSDFDGKISSEELLLYRYLHYNGEVPKTSVINFIDKWAIQ